MTKPSIAIIGAGVAGLTAARIMQRAGYSPTIYEKSRGLGGRIATRRIEGDSEFDHGAQYFTAETDAFKEFLERTNIASNIAGWSPHGKPNDYEKTWWVGTPRMNSPFKASTHNLDIRLRTRIADITRLGKGYRLRGEEINNRLVYDYVMVTTPAPQALDLIKIQTSMRDQIGSIKIAPCWTLLAILAGEARPEQDVYQSSDGPISWAARNNSKPGRPSENETWVIQASPQWSTEYLECEKEEIKPRLIPLMCELFGMSHVELSYADAHRWRYARVMRAAGVPFLADETGTLFYAGDGCLGPRVECAFESGLAAAEALNTQHRNDSSHA